MSYRPSFAALRSLSLPNRSLARLAICFRRQFSSTPAYGTGVRAIFAETNNKELGTILKHIQETIIFPAYLPEKQRNMVFNPNMRSTLEQNPIVIEVEGVEHRFSTIDRFHDIPNSKAILHRAVSRMRTAEDWNKLATLLAGYRKAGIVVNTTTMGQIFRLAGSGGHVYPMIECAIHAEKTGFFLTARELVARMFLSINDYIITNRFHANKTKEAVRWLETLLELLQKPEHVDVARSQDKMHFWRSFRGMVLFARCSIIKAKQRLAEEQLAGLHRRQAVDQDITPDDQQLGQAVGQDMTLPEEQLEQAVDRDMTLLEEEVSLLSSLWKDSLKVNLLQLEDFSSLNPTVERAGKPRGVRRPQALNGSGYVKLMAFNIEGITMARELAGAAAEDLAPVQEALEQHLREYMQTAIGRVPRWADDYRWVTGKELDMPSDQKGPDVSSDQKGDVPSANPETERAGV